jgi:hypothetical protein
MRVMMIIGRLEEGGGAVVGGLCVLSKQRGGQVIHGSSDI